MPQVTITGEDLKKLVNAEKGTKIVELLRELEPASSMLTLSVALSSIIPSVCDTPDDAEKTLSELARLMNDLISRVYAARESGELKIQSPTWDKAQWGN